MDAVLKTTGREEPAAGEQVPIPCFRCGICCTCYQAPLDTRDIENISSVLGISQPEFIARYALKVPIREGYLLRKVGSDCIFLSRDKGETSSCVIHPSRPQACREWQPGLSQPACLEGLVRLKTKGELTRMDELLGSDEERREFYSSLEQALATTGHK